MTLQKSLAEWEKTFEMKIREVAIVDAAAVGNDPAHDHAHFLRVVTTAKRLAHAENAKLEVVIPAAWLHDFVNVPKNDPRRSMASRLSGEAAIGFLRSEGYPEAYLAEIQHAIEAHSFSANIEVKSKEAAVVQDADRLDGVGAIGIARAFTVGGMLRRRIYEPTDPFGAHGRVLDDLENTVDHFFVKLFKTVASLKTDAGRVEGEKRLAAMRSYLIELGRELGKDFIGPNAPAPFSR